VLVIAAERASEPRDSRVLARRWTAEAIGRATGRAATRTFLIVRAGDVVAVLDAGGDAPADVVLRRAHEMLLAQHGVVLTAGIGTPFGDLAGLRGSYREAQRAARHADAERPIIRSPDDISLFEDLTAAADTTAHDLIPAATRTALQDPALRATLQAFIEADLNVTATADALVMHPNSVRYRLRRIARQTGRDPQRLRDLLELATAARLMDAEDGSST